MELLDKISRNTNRIKAIHEDSGWSWVKVLLISLKLYLSRGFTLTELHDYEFDRFSKDYLDSFLNGKEQLHFLSLLNPRKYYSLARNKYWTHVFLETAGIHNKAELFCYYNPELRISTNDKIGYDIFSVSKCLKDKNVTSCVIKTTESSHGDNVFVIRNVEYRNDEIVFTRFDGVRMLLNDILKKEPLVFESIIEQTKQLSNFNPSSVNTIRFMTILLPDGNADTIAAFIKIGRSGKCIDNAGDGGNIDACVDVESGELKYAIQFEGWRKTHDIEKHPDTDCQINGIVIENWDSIKRTVESFQQALPFVKAAGWDIAITDRGPIVVEVNDMWDRTGQLFIRKGWKKQIEQCYNQWKSYYNS